MSYDGKHIEKFAQQDMHMEHMHISILFMEAARNFFMVLSPLSWNEFGGIVAPGQGFVKSEIFDVLSVIAHRGSSVCFPVVPKKEASSEASFIFLQKGLLS